jgi:hypothetical protein
VKRQRSYYYFEKPLYINQSTKTAESTGRFSLSLSSLRLYSACELVALPISIFSAKKCKLFKIDDPSVHLLF